MTVEPKWYREHLAEALGVEVKSLTRKTKLPEPDGHDLVGGHARPYWFQSRAQEWIAGRPGRGRWMASRPAKTVTESGEQG